MTTDGFSTRARVRSVTHIDQQVGLASSWSRQAYYAGVAPTQGLVYPQDAQVHPLHYMTPANPGGVARTRRVLEHVGDQMRFRVGYFPSRTTVQFMVTQCRETARRLEIEKTGDQLSVINQLGETIRYLLVKDEDGTLYVRRDELRSEDDWAPWPDGKKEALRVGQRERQIALVTRLVADARLETPPGFDRSMLRDRMFGGGGGWGNNARNDLGILERRLQSAIGVDANNWGARSYMAITDGCGEVSMGVQDAQLTGSLFVITGKY